MVHRSIRLFIMLAFAGIGLYLGRTVADNWNWSVEISWAANGLGVIIGGLLGFFLAPFILKKAKLFVDWLEGGIQKLPAQDVMGGVTGLIIGLIIASLLGVSFFRLPFIGPFLPIIGSIILGYLGWRVGTKRREDIISFIQSFYRRSNKAERGFKKEGATPKILDTSVIIDGRIADICRSGFIEGSLIIPSFVLEELRHIADSSDILKRNRGRRGLDILNKIRNELDIKVNICEKDFEDISEVDSKLVKLARVFDALILTNDYNLNKVAELQGVKVLNINELANAVKPVVLPGEEMQVQVIKDGKETGQGVGYLDDGTMIVVENGKRFIGQNIGVMVTSVLQTAAGRMIFAKPKVVEHKQGFSQFG